MGRQGFIHGKLDIKFLILYIMARVAAPIDFPTLTDLTMVDDGVDYFEFAEAAAELVSTGHLQVDGELYSITDKGRANGGECESSLPYSVRSKCGRRLSRLNAALRRNAQVRAQLLPREEGGVSLQLCLDDDAGNLLTVELLCPSQEQAQRLAASFRARPEQVYNGILDLLTPLSGEEEEM